jgi:hypothetical protein
MRGFDYWNSVENGDPCLTKFTVDNRISLDFVWRVEVPWAVGKCGGIGLDY